MGIRRLILAVIPLGLRVLGLLGLNALVVAALAVAARGELAIRRLRDTVGDDNVVEFSVCAGGPGEAEPPLGWELSREMIERLNGQVSSCLSQPVARLCAVVGRHVAGSRDLPPPTTDNFL